MASTSGQPNLVPLELAIPAVALQAPRTTAWSHLRSALLLCSSCTCS